MCEKCAGQMMHRAPRLLLLLLLLLLQMKSEPTSRNTQQDKTTTLHHADGGDRMPEARLSCSPMTNKPHGEGTSSFTRGSRGSREGTEGSHLHNHNGAEYL